MKSYLNQLKEATQYINEKITIKPTLGLVLGSGLGDLSDEITEKVEINYSDIPHFPVPTVKGHDGKLVCGILQGKKVIAMKGRFHYYEGYDLEKSVFGIRVMKLLGINKVIITNAAGGVNLDFEEGMLMIITDHIGLFAPSTLRGENLEEFGPRFPDMTFAYDKEFIKIANNHVNDINIPVKKGVYAFYRGPNFETPSEIKALRILGTDAVGMSTVPEVIAANHASMRVLGISCITNMAAGVEQKKLTHQEVMDTTTRVKSDFIKFVKNIIGEL